MAALFSLNNEHPAERASVLSGPHAAPGLGSAVAAVRAEALRAGP